MQQRPAATYNNNMRRPRLWQQVTNVTNAGFVFKTGFGFSFFGDCRRGTPLEFESLKVFICFKPFSVRCSLVTTADGVMAAELVFPPSTHHHQLKKTWRIVQVAGAERPHMHCHQPLPLPLPLQCKNCARCENSAWMRCDALFTSLCLSNFEPSHGALKFCFSMIVCF
jgi:hypothetical protein